MKARYNLVSEAKYIPRTVNRRPWNFQGFIFRKYVHLAHETQFFNWNEYCMNNFRLDESDLPE